MGTEWKMLEQMIKIFRLYRMHNDASYGAY
jgi:hypothetical protein